MPDVRTTFDPDRLLVVDEREAYDLRQQGLLVDQDVDKAPAEDPSTGPHPDAAKAQDEANAQRREDLGEDKAKGRSGAKAKDNERS